MKKQIPNVLTCLNLLSGVISITLVMRGNLVAAGLMIFVAAVFDYLDGTMARLLDARSELGKQLDSLSDVVSFGVAPGILVFQMISVNCGSCNLLEKFHFAPYFALLIPVCAALRLAKFNIDIRQEETFYGLPSPANGLFFASLPLVVFLQPNLFSLIRMDFMVEFFSNSRILAMLAVFFSYLMISDFQIFSMKFKSLKWQGNEVRVIFLICATVMIILFSISAIPLIILTYLLLSLFFQKKIA
ncbi:MAG: CDP-diacylglycerol--serine O-phosphatidyltransferase [Bacteroidota bacterium]